MNATVRTLPLTAKLLTCARELARWHEDEGRSGTAVAIHTLVAEIETLREAAYGSAVIVNQAVTAKNLAALKASTLLIAAEKIAPVLDDEIEQRKAGCNPQDWAALQALSNELHAAMRLVKS